MGIHHETGYSADVEGFFVVNGERVRIAKSNGSTFVLAEPCELPPNTEGDLLTIIDGNRDSRRIELPYGVIAGQTTVDYRELAPF
jgi:hypothetical protein